MPRSTLALVVLAVLVSQQSLVQSADPQQALWVRGDAARTGTFSDAGPTGRPECLWSDFQVDIISVYGGKVWSGDYWSRAEERDLATGQPIDQGAATESPSSHIQYVGEYVSPSRVYDDEEAGAHLYAVDPASGDEIWEAWIPEGDSPNFPPAVQEGVAYFTGNVGGMYAVDTVTGDLLWASGLVGEEDELSFSIPAVADDLMFAANEDNYLYALDTRNGDIVWYYDLDDNGYAVPAVADGTVYVTGVSKLHAIDVETGSAKWVTDLGGDWHSSAAVANGLVYVVTGTTLHVVDATEGGEVWSFDLKPLDAGSTEDGVRSAPVVADGVVYVGSQFGILYALDAKTGRKQWEYEDPDQDFSTMIVADRMIAVVGGSTRSLCILGGN